MIELAWCWAAATDVGLVRFINEDRWGIDEEIGLFIVCDGMGGHASGEVAAQIVVETLPLLLKKQLGMPTNGGNPAEMLCAALIETSTRVRDAARDSLELEGMGATVVSLWLYGDAAWIGHIGDSRAYLWRDDFLTALTQDHSFVALLLESGDITPEQAVDHPSRHQVTRYAGMDGETLPDVRTIEISRGDRLLLCTDGLTGMVEDSTINALLKGVDLEAASATLIEMANNAGGKDNTTVVLLEIT